MHHAVACYCCFFADSVMVLHNVFLNERLLVQSVDLVLQVGCTFTFLFTFLLALTLTLTWTETTAELMFQCLSTSVIQYAQGTSKQPHRNKILGGRNSVFEPKLPIYSPVITSEASLLGLACLLAACPCRFVDARFLFPDRAEN